MKQIYEYLTKETSKFKILKEKYPDRFWVKGQKNGTDIRCKNNNSFLVKRINKDTDWKEVSSIHLNKEEVAYICTNGDRASVFRYNGSFDIGGNILGLTRLEYNLDDDINDKEFQGAFADSDIIDCRDLIITSNRIGAYGMAHMFANCPDIIYSPKLPSKNLGEGCYMSMFEESGVKYACEELPATILVKNCYNDMYYSCWNLISTPKSLPATKLAKGCYAGMFGDCNNLKNIKFSDLPAKKMEENCYLWMFNSSDIINTPKIHAEVLAKGCFDGMFTYCNNIKDITFTSPKMSCSLATYRDYFNEWNEPGEMAENVTLTISKNADIFLPDSWTVKRI